MSAVQAVRARGRPPRVTPAARFCIDLIDARPGISLYVMCHELDRAGLPSSARTLGAVHRHLHGHGCWHTGTVWGQWWPPDLAARLQAKTVPAGTVSEAIAALLRRPERCPDPRAPRPGYL